ncbi:MAG: hypothetical protein IJJ15_03195 [Ruminococcus sp.]|nr:hypothetical protein [Ruminococcus sp.]
MPQSTMEQEALERVRRMYGSFDTRKPAPPKPEPSHPKKEEKPEGELSPPKPSQEKNLLDELLKDNERSLILLLLLVLYSEKADASLLLSLMYLIL